MQQQALKKRGRSPGDKKPPAPGTSKKTAETPPAAKSTLTAAVAGAARAGFCFVLERDGRKTAFRFQSLKAKGEVPDYRRYTGVERELLREFQARRRDEAQELILRFDGTAREDTLYDPGEQLISLALSSGLLANEKGLPLKKGPRARCILRLEEAKTGALRVFPAIADEDGLVPGEGGFLALAPDLGLWGDTVYPIQNLGRRWPDMDRLQARLSRQDLPTFLSLAFSNYPNLELSSPGWTVRRIRPVQAQPALLFMGIDDYDYLHVRPLSYLKGFPPLFLENEEIITIVETDEASRTLGIAEVIFPEPPEDTFRSILFKGNRKTGKDQVYEEKGRFIIAPEFAQSFLSESIMDLMSRFVLLETKVLSQYKLSFSRPKFRFSLGSGIDYLEGDVTVDVGDETFSFTRFMEEYRRDSCITLSDGTRSFPDKETMDRVERLITRVKGDEAAVSFFDIPLLLQHDDLEVSGEGWEKGRTFFEGYNSIASREGDFPLASGSLRPYQVYGAKWLDYLREHHMGACLADEMGLGKTIQVIALLRRLYTEHAEEGLCLILSPKSLVYNWAAEIKRFAPELPYTVYYGTGRNLVELDEPGFRIVLSTYATIRIDAEEFQKRSFLYIILDESQNIKNLSTQTSAAVLSFNAEHRLALSGTPVENNLADLYSLFRFLNPTFFGTEKFFVSRYLHPIQDSGDEEALRDLRMRIYPFMLRRLKRDVLSELPEKSEETAWIELDEAHLAAYHRRRMEYKRMISGFIDAGEYKKQSFMIFKALSELRRLASVPESEAEFESAADSRGFMSAKRQYLREFIPEITANGHKCLIFTNFLAQVDLVSQDLNALGIGNLVMTGATADRQSLVTRFQTDSEVKAFVMTLKTGGAGLNLTAADYIFILDPWWNRAAETQAIDRAHRIGQSNPVICFRLIARDTIEERILELQQRKADLAGALLADDAGSLKSLSADDVSYLVEGFNGQAAGPEVSTWSENDG